MTDNDLAAALEWLAANLPDEVSSAMLQDRPALRRIILAAEDIGGRISLANLERLKVGWRD